MAVIITELRTTLQEADAITNWTGSPTLFTTDPDPVELTGCIGYQVSTATIDAYATIASTNLTNKLIYVWVFPRGAMDLTSLGGIGVHIGDGTNRISFHVAGSDIAGFRHDVGPVGWYCVVLDTGNLPTTNTVRAGTLGGLNFAAVTQIGATFKTLAKSVGGAPNCFIDIIRSGDPTLNDGAMLRIAGGTNVTPGKFSEIALADRSNANLTAYGVLRETNTGAFGLQAALQFGTPTGTTSSWFEDINSSVAFESRGLLTTRYGIIIRDNGVGTTTFKLGSKVGTGTAAGGSSGCSIVAAAGVGAFWDSKSDTNVTDVFLYGSTFTGFTGGFRMRTGQEMAGCTVSSSGIIEPTGDGTFTGEVFFLINGWKIVIDHTCLIDGVLFSDDPGGLFITAANTQIVTNKVSAIVQLVIPSLSELNFPNASQNAEAVWGYVPRTLTTTEYTGPSVSEIRTEMDTNSTSLQSLQTAVNTIPTAAEISQQVWDYSLRELSTTMEPIDFWNFLLTTPMVPGSAGEKLKQILTTSNFLALK